MFQLGIDVFLSNKKLRQSLKGKKVALLGHPASVTQKLNHSIDALAACKEFKLTAAFGPQHGMKGDKQYNMLETPTENDPVKNIPVFSLYSDARRPSGEMLDQFDVVLVDLQDVGCRIYTYITTLLYMMEACAPLQKKIIVCDRPNPIGREVEGYGVDLGFESFVAASDISIRHGMTIGELALFFNKELKLNCDLQIIKMKGYTPKKAPWFGWPGLDLAWVNPSPNAPQLTMARSFPGVVLIEGTTLSEGRGTTRPLEWVGAPDIDFQKVLDKMKKLAPKWLLGCELRVCYFEPTFYKHKDRLCSALQIHTDPCFYDPKKFKPFRLVALMLKAIRMLYPEYPLWRDFKYEYVDGRLPIDTISGSSYLREWVDDPNSRISDFEKKCVVYEKKWIQRRKKYLLYS